MAVHDNTCPDTCQCYMSGFIVKPSDTCPTKCKCKKDSPTLFLNQLRMRIVKHFSNEPKLRFSSAWEFLVNPSSTYGITINSPGDATLCYIRHQFLTEGFDRIVADMSFWVSKEHSEPLRDDDYITIRPFQLTFEKPADPSKEFKFFIYFGNE